MEREVSGADGKHEANSESTVAATAAGQHEEELDRSHPTATGGAFAVFTQGMEEVKRRPRKPTAQGQRDQAVKMRSHEAMNIFSAKPSIEPAGTESHSTVCILDRLVSSC